ncbi:pectin acetylesterase-family hydrolase [Nevskia ramosa]|uniref:pectin acetylesterase-family hydrolase n=1 Tax=Nevskia ramosa TaxID=64002 RepID=UPI002356433D|nr:pectin acetylesterase-family hydrolase [Nevskia ramosa]
MDHPFRFRAFDGHHRLLATLVVAASCSACGGSGGDSSSSPVPANPSTIPGDFTKQTIDLSTYPDAVCNDGSPAIFYIQRGVGAAAATNANKTVIGLRGGGFCLSDADCRGRPSDLKSSIGYPSQTAPEGMLSSDSSNDNFRSWNRVSVPYCSSDFFSGDIGATGSPINFRFRGAKIVAAVVQTLNRQYGIGKAGDTVVLAGGSAGAVGAFINANRVRAALPGASVLAVIDAGIYPDVAPLMPGIPPWTSVRDLGPIGLSYWNGQVDADCAAANPGNPGNCYLFEHAQSTLRMPFFVIQNARDAVGIINVGLLRNDGSIDNSSLGSWVRATYLPAMGNILRPLGLSSGQGVFAVCLDPEIHTLSSDTTLWTTPMAEVGGVALKDAVASWAAAGGAATRAVTSASCTFP